jgi:prepilin-type N-terminal cleavage/methylation domain-containing protein
MKNKRKAFTLIELLVVISIIALLMAVLVPVLGKVRDSAKRTLCSNNLRNIWLATNLYAAESNGKVSLRKYTTEEQRKECAKCYGRYSAYIPDKSVFTCPALTTHEETAAGGITMYKPLSGELAGMEIKVTYTMNDCIAMSIDSRDANFERWYTLEDIQKFAFRNHWMGIFIGDGIAAINNLGDWRSLQKSAFREGFASYRHSGKAMFLTTDGGMGSFDEKDLESLPRQGHREITPSMLK